MKVYKLFLFCTFFIPACSENIVEPGLEENEYLIYQEILQNEFENFDGMIVINDSTHSEQFNLSNIQSYCQELGLDVETMTSYIKRNNTKTRINKISGINCIFQSEFKHNQNDFTYVQISRAGFNSNFTQAIVTMGKIYSHTDTGEGKLFVLEKIDISKWIIKKSVMLWIA